MVADILPEVLGSLAEHTSIVSLVEEGVVFCHLLATLKPCRVSSTRPSLYPVLPMDAIFRRGRSLGQLQPVRGSHAPYFRRHVVFWQVRALAALPTILSAWDAHGDSSLVAKQGMYYLYNVALEVSNLVSWGH